MIKWLIEDLGNAKIKRRERKRKSIRIWVGLFKMGKRKKKMKGRWVWVGKLIIGNYLICKRGNKMKIIFKVSMLMLNLESNRK